MLCFKYVSFIVTSRRSIPPPTLQRKRLSSALPAAGTNSLAPGNTRFLAVCFVACRYGERAPQRAAMDIIFAQNKRPPLRNCGHDLALTNLACNSLFCFTRNPLRLHNVPHYVRSDRSVPFVFSNISR